MYSEMKEGQANVVDDLVNNLKREAKKPPAIKPANTTPAEIKPPPKQAARPKSKNRSKKVLGAPKNDTPTLAAPTGPKLPKQNLNKPIGEYATFLETFAPEDRDKLMRDAAAQARVGYTTFDRRLGQIESRSKEAVKTGYELFTKYSSALVCFIFLFIGAPMGAIIRKGGFGYPILVSIIFFVVFIMLTIMCRKLAEAYVLSPFWAAMTPCIMLLPIAAFLSRKAMNDSQMINTDRFDRLAFLLRRWFAKKEATPAA
ncbi:MAG: LptF/LptG family permease [Saprospiraceae bacterium]|nr:LptF/LptG family permease [Saprospiraceae bacterium]